jgi:hypothetical protein
MKKKSEKKIAKGYRLKPATHKIIRDIRYLLRGDLDYALNTACTQFLKEIKQNHKPKELK